MGRSAAQHESREVSPDVALQTIGICQADNCSRIGGASIVSAARAADRCRWILLTPHWMW
jgi:hypothetical protein